MPVVSDTSPLFNLAAIDQLQLLRLQFEQVFVPEFVLEELKPIRGSEAWTLVQRGLAEGWIASRPIQDYDTFRTLNIELDRGEAEAITLAKELELSTILIDEREGRSVATHLGLKVVGVLGVLLKAEKQHEVAPGSER